MDLHLKIGRHRLGLVKELGPSMPAESLLGGLTGGIPGPKNVAQTLDANRGWAYACVDVIASRVASVDSALYAKRKKAGKEQLDKIDDHIFYDLLDKGNPHFNRWRLMYLLSAHRNLAGLGYWYLYANGLGRPQSIWPLEPHKIEKTVKDGKVFYKYQRDTKGPLELDPERVLEFPKPNVKDIYSGWSPLQAGSLPYDIGQYIDDYQYKLFRNGAWFMYALSTKQSLQPHEITRIRDSWMNLFRRSGDRFKPPVLHSGTEVISGPTNLDLDLGALDDRSRDKILALYRVPKSKLGYSESANKASMFAANVAFNEEVILPELTQIQDVINDKLIPMYGKQGLPKVFKFANPVPTDREEIRADVDLAMKHGTMTDNEARERLGLTPVPDGDVRYKPFNLVPINSNGQSNARSTGSKIVLPEGRTVPRAFTKAFWTEDKLKTMWDIFKATTEQQEKLWVPILKKLLKAQEIEVLAKLDASPLLGKYAGWAKPKVEADILKQDVPTIDPDEWAEITIEAGLPVIRQIVEEAGEDAITLIDSSLSFDLADPRVVELISERSVEFAKINVKTSEQIRAVISEGITEGESIEQLRARVMDKFNEITEGRARTIARTETASASNAAAKEGYQQAGVELKSWLSARSGDYREDHLTAENMYAEGSDPGPIPIDEDFELPSGSRGPQPLSMDDVAENVNCRCVVLPVQED